MSIIEQIDYQLIELRGNPLVPCIRQGIARVIIEASGEIPDTYWAKEHVVLACQHFNGNTASNLGRRGCTDWWLTLCLLRLRDAFLPAGSYDDRATPRNPVIAAMSIRELSSQVRDHLMPFAVS
jgi:hypothetical protein